MNESKFPEEIKWAEVTASANAADEAVDLSRDELNGSEKAFFVGILKAGDPESEPFASDASMAVSKAYVVSNAISVIGGSERNINFTSPITRPFKFKEGDFVFGLEPARSLNPFLFSTEGRIYPVQLIPWDSFKESEDEPSAHTFFSRASSQGVLTVRHPYVIGNAECPGQVIIFDGNAARRGVHLSGFVHVGGGKVRVSDVRFFTGDFNNQVLLPNQPTSFDYMGNPVWVLIPPETMEGPHAVLKCTGWEPLTAVLQEQLPAKTSDEKSVPPPQSPSVQDAREEKTDRATDLRTAGDAGDGHQVAENLSAAQQPQDPVGEKTLSVLPASFVSPKRIKLTEPSEGGDELELDFLERFYKYTRWCRFDYDPRDIIRFYTSVKCGKMVVLGGAPGTGKSSLAALYVSFLSKGLRKSKIAVSPAWVEPADLIGAIGITKKFIPSTSGFADELRAAVQGKDNLYPICFDEMNLACIEHYFSPFMPVNMFDLSSDEVISGYKDAGYPEEKELPKSDLKFPCNARIIGTCNNDSTVRPLSARFLDRCSYIELASNVKGFVDEIPGGILCPSDEFIPQSFPNSGRWVCDATGGELCKEVQLEFAKSDNKGCLFELLCNAGLTPSKRVIVQMQRYIASRPNPRFEGSLDEASLQRRALDEALAQYVLSHYVPAISSKMKEAQSSLHKYLANSSDKYRISLDLLNSYERRFGESL